MNKANLKTYAPQARKDFIAAVTARAHRLGLAETNGKMAIAPAEKSGDLVLIAGQSWPAKISRQRDNLIDLIFRHGFAQTMENVAYTWFNRFAALRYMEIHDYLNHGYRVLSSREGGLPEILSAAPELAQNGDLPGLNPQRAIELKLAGDQDGELYRLTLIAQCNALSKAMPFLFEKIDDETELLLPDNLLLTDSVIAKLFDAIPEEDWSQVEIIGWLYQFYISEKKDQVIGKVVKSEDIPAATQLFTPNWIVKYMVQNSLGAQWLATYPQSPLKGQMEYYIEPAEQTEEVKAQLAAITPSQLNPEELTLIDPASGSGHILVEAYELFKAIYLERGYRQRDVPQLILEKNLFGLDIDERAAQLTGFALMMKGRADDRRLFERGVMLNVMALVDSAGFDAEGLAKGVELSDYGLKPGDLTELKRLFEHATTFGSLIQVPERLAEKLPALKQLSEATSQDLFASEALKHLEPLVQQAELLAAQYDAVVANPPYMSRKFCIPLVKQFLAHHFEAGKADLYAAFVIRNIRLSATIGRIGMITIPNWMFLSSYEGLRETILEHAPISSLAHNGRGVWGSDFGSCSFILNRSHPTGLAGLFLRLFNKQGSVASNEELAQRFKENSRYTFINKEFRRIPGSPIAYWASDVVRDSFGAPSIREFAISVGQQKTGDNEKYVRAWWELQLSTIGKDRKWLTYVKGGPFQKWFGNLEHVIDWSEEARKYYREDNRGRIIQEEYWYKPGISWTFLTASYQSYRFLPTDAVSDITGSSIYFKSESQIVPILGFLNSAVCRFLTSLTNPSLALQVRNVMDLPMVFPPGDGNKNVATRCLKLTQDDYRLAEISADFCALPLLAVSSEPTPTLESSYTAWITQNRDTIAEMKRLEEENNRLFIDAYGLADEITPDVPIEQITLTVNPAYRYGGKLTIDAQWTRFRQDTMEELVSYAIGCMMGRYSLDEPGLIYAHAGNVGFDATRYKTFAVDADGIVPITDELWFGDDAANRIREFLLAVWGAEILDENLAWLAESLGQKANETPAETIRRYLAGSFFKDHLKTYKKRPIYWLFSSGKQGAFQALVYLHRYHEGTLARMRAEYVVPLTGKIQSRIEMLEKDAAAASSNAARNKLNKDIEKLRKKHVELLAFDEKLRHYADQRIKLDLDDGVKVNYGKFGDLLADVKAVCGNSEE